MLIYPEELASINNPDILASSLEEYKEFNLNINGTNYDIYLKTCNDYIHKGGVFIAIHNLDDNLLDKLDDYNYLSYDMDSEWNIYDINEMLKQCDNCKSHYFDEECKKCPILVVEKHYIQNKYINIPIDRGYYSMDETPLKTKIFIDDEIIMSFDISTESRIIFWYPLNLERYTNKILTLTIDPGDLNRRRMNKITKHLDTIFKFHDEPAFDKTLTPIKQLYRHNHHGYAGDLNGLVHLNGVFHMFYQNDPFICEGKNMFWGHATSKDLFTWKDEGLALKPYIDAKDQCFSGSGNVKDGKMFFMFTDTGAGETLAHYDNVHKKIVPDKVVLKHTGRDPKVIKYKNHWVMIVSYIGDNVKEFRFYVSDDLYNWRHTCSIDDMYECPEFIKFDVYRGVGKETIEKWLLFEASNKYMIGSFDGEVFTPDDGVKIKSHTGTFATSQCFTNFHHNIQIGNIKLGELHDSYVNTFSTPLQLYLHELNGLYLLKMDFITNLKPNEIVTTGSRQELYLDLGYTIIKGAEKIKIGGFMGGHTDDNNFKFYNISKEDIHIISDKHVYEVIVGNLKYFAAQKYEDAKLCIWVNY